MNFLHSDLGFRHGGDVVEVTLSAGANVRLLDSSNFQRYRRGAKHRYYGGLARRSPTRITIPHSGHWHAVVDMQGLRGSTRAGFRVIPGSTLRPLPPIRERREEITSIVENALAAGEDASRESARCAQPAGREPSYPGSSAGRWPAAQYGDLHGQRFASRGEGQRRQPGYSSASRRAGRDGWCRDRGYQRQRSQAPASRGAPASARRSDQSRKSAMASHCRCATCESGRRRRWPLVGSHHPKSVSGPPAAGSGHGRHREDLHAAIGLVTTKRAPLPEPSEIDLDQTRAQVG